MLHRLSTLLNFVYLHSCRQDSFWPAPNTFERWHVLIGCLQCLNWKQCAHFYGHSNCSHLRTLWAYSLDQLLCYCFKSTTKASRRRSLPDQLDAKLFTQRRMCGLTREEIFLQIWLKPDVYCLVGIWCWNFAHYLHPVTWTCRSH